MLESQSNIISSVAAAPIMMVGTTESVTKLTPALKRKHGADDESGSSKRQKVAFNTSVKVRLVEDWKEKPLSLVREEVRKALDQWRRGDYSGVESLKQLLMAKPGEDDAPSTSLLRKYIVAMTGFVHAMGRDCGGLVDALLNCNWLGRHEDFVGDFFRLLSALISTHGGYGKPVLQWLVTHLTNLRPSEGRLPDHDFLKRAQLLDRLHAGLEHIVNFVPSTLGVLEAMLAASFPYPTDEAKMHVDYVSSLLRLISYAKPLQTTVLQLVTEHVVKIDVGIQVDIDELDEEVDDGLGEGLLGKVMSQLNRNAAKDATKSGQEEDNNKDDDDEADDEDEDDSDAESEISTVADEATQRLDALRDSIAKLDALLDLLFDYYSKALTQGSDHDRLKTFEQLVAIFVRSVLPTYNSRHTQFLLFHFGQSHQDFFTHFTSALSTITFDKNKPISVRVSAAAYLASFVARASLVDGKSTRMVFELLADQLEVYRKSFEANSTGPDPHRYRLYYAMFQACMYIFCFRWRDFTVGFNDDDDEVDDDELKWLPGIKDNLTRQIHSTFNPLRVCSPAIVSQFARITNHLNFIYLYSLLETNKRVRLGRSLAHMSSSASLTRESALSARVDETSLQLEAQFPFDPYTLPRSKRWLAGEYMEWQSPVGMDDGQDDDDSDTSDEEDLEEVAQEIDEPTETDEE